MPDLLPYPDFSQPWIQSADVVLDQNGGATDEDQIDAEDLFNLSYDAVVDKFIVFENSLRDPAADPGADTQLLGDIDGRFWMLKTQNSSNQDMPVVTWDDAPIHRVVPVVHGMQEPWDWAAIGMRFRPGQLTVPANGILSCAWENPTVTAALAVPAGTLHLALRCRTRDTRRPTNLYLPVSFLASAGSGASGPTSTQGYTASSKNPWAEELEAQDIRMWLDGGYGANANWADTRTLRHLLVRPLIQPGEISLNGKTNYVPVVGFGADRQLDHMVATMDYSEEPLLIEKGDGVSFRFTNKSACKTRVTVVAVMRRRPM